MKIWFLLFGILFVFSASAKDVKTTSGFKGDVQISTQFVPVQPGLLSSATHSLVQIVDRTNKVVCYGKVGGSSSSISCTPIKK